MLEACETVVRKSSFQPRQRHCSENNPDRSQPMKLQEVKGGRVGPPGSGCLPWAITNSGPANSFIFPPDSKWWEVAACHAVLRRIQRLFQNINWKKCTSMITPIYCLSRGWGHGWVCLLQCFSLFLQGDSILGGEDLKSGIPGFHPGSAFGHMTVAPVSHLQMAVIMTIVICCTLLSWCHALFKRALCALTCVILTSA